MTLTRAVLPLFLGFLASLPAVAQTPGADMPKPRMIYVLDFEAHTGDSGGSDSSRTGALSRRRRDRSSEKAVTSAGSLSGAIAEQFKALGYPAQRLSREAALPKEGWLVTGIFYALDAQTGRIQRPSLTKGKPDSANTKITVSVADLAVNPAAPFIVFGTAEALQGQGPPVGWNPYVVAAKFVLSQVESEAEIRKLAAQIVDTILKNKATIEEEARKPGN